ncbi:SDR family oxidoreductase [Acidicapsa ligni]|uniref:SDR family oxidoreductase n=1 Tax=Acidicapsa ligni TaxID=542300 RepID=UPI0021E02966|nr:SDR family NAD(P)-dependent oxidoreductase [Acidicapsa ligni]
MNIQGNTILITGGGSGIGRGLAEALQKQGNKIIIAGRRESVLQETAKANPGMEYAVLDTSNAGSIQAAAAKLTSQYPDLNVVINNAGVQRVIDFAAGYDDAAAQEEISTNISGVLRMAAAFLPHLRTKASATIVNISSGLAFVPMARYPVYSATKAFVHSFSMSLRLQLKDTSVRVVELAPPWVGTDLDASHPERAAHEGMSPMPLPAFINAAMEELASDEDELKVAGAKFLYAGGVSEKQIATFAQINH